MEVNQTCWNIVSIT